MEKHWAELLETFIMQGDFSNEAFLVWSDRYMEETGDDSLAELGKGNPEQNEALFLNVLL
jgi:hypothetical protein